ncbi:hypothetical protein BLA29_008884, partial [Euroglyphus maynei]
YGYGPALAAPLLAGGPLLAAGPLLPAAYAAAPAVVAAAVQSRHHVQYYDVPTTGHVQPITIDVGANVVPVNMIFRSASSHLNVEQSHLNQGGSVQETASQDEPHLLRHTVTKPILQEVREVITPFRRIQQEIQPVQEEVKTLVARGHPTAAAAPLLAAAPAPTALLAAPAPAPLLAAAPALAAPAPLLSSGPLFLAQNAGLAYGNAGFAAAPLFAGKGKYLK